MATKLSVHEAFPLVCDIAQVLLRRLDRKREDVTFTDVDMAARRHRLVVEHLPADGYIIRSAKADSPLLAQSVLPDQESAEFAACHVFIKVFDGDVDRWLQWLREHGTDEQVLSDFPIAVTLKKRLYSEPDLLAKIRAMVAADTPSEG